MPQLGALKYCHNVRYEKLAWWVYWVMKKVSKYVHTFWDDTPTWRTDGQPAGQTDTARRHSPRLYTASRCEIMEFVWIRVARDRQSGTDLAAMLFIVSSVTVLEPVASQPVFSATVFDNISALLRPAANKQTVSPTGSDKTEISPTAGRNCRCQSRIISF